MLTVCLHVNFFGPVGRTTNTTPPSYNYTVYMRIAKDCSSSSVVNVIVQEVKVI